MGRFQPVGFGQYDIHEVKCFYNTLVGLAMTVILFCKITNMILVCHSRRLHMIAIA